MPLPPSGRSITAPAVLLGVGLGGFVDGIVLHQIFKWHHMLSETDAYPPTTLANLEVNVLADGLFHAVTWIVVAIGLAALWSRARRGGWVWPGRALLGWMAVGWGVFNVIEGVVDHHLLRIHRVNPNAADPLLWDLGFLAFGVALIVGGWLLQRSALPARAPVRSGAAPHASSQEAAARP